MALEVLATGPGQKIKITVSFGHSNGYGWSRTFAQQEFSRSGTMPGSARAGLRT